MFRILAYINGAWRPYECESIADVEALQDVFAKQGIEYRNVA